MRSDHPASLRAWMRYKGMRSTVDAWVGLAESAQRPKRVRGRARDVGLGVAHRAPGRVAGLCVDDAPGHRDQFSPLLDLHTLTQRDGGRLRSLAELSALLTDAGLRPTGRRFSVVPHDLIEAEKI